MNLAKAFSAALATIACLVLSALSAGLSRAGPQGPDEGDRLTRPTRVALDFRDRPVAEVIQEIARRSGKTIAVGIGHSPIAAVGGRVMKGFAPEADPGWRGRRITLVAPEPVPLWEALDRLAEAGRIGYHMANYGDSGAGTTGVMFQESGDADALVQYTGRFRVALRAVHEHHEIRYVPRVGPPASLGAPEVGIAPTDGGPFYAEIRLMSEPGLISRRDGAVKVAEAVDDQGRDLTIPSPARPVAPWDLLGAFDGGVSPNLRVPLKRPGAGPPGARLRRLRGSIPVEVAVLRPAPALVVPLAGAEGRTFRGGGFAVEVRTARAEPAGPMTLALTVREDVAAEPSVRNARQTTLMRHQYRVVDARGRPVRFATSGAGGGGDGVRLDFHYRPNPGLNTEPPAEFRLFGLERVAWEVPFEFREVVLP